MTPAVMSAVFFAASGNQNRSHAMTEDQNSSGTEQTEDESKKTFFQKNVLDYKELAKEEFKIPHLLQEREKQMQKEYQERDGVNVDELGITSKEFKELKELDMMYGGQTSKEEMEEIQ